MLNLILNLNYKTIGNYTEKYDSPSCLYAFIIQFLFLCKLFNIFFENRSMRVNVSMWHSVEMQWYSDCGTMCVVPSYIEERDGFGHLVGRSRLCPTI